MSDTEQNRPDPGSRFSKLSRTASFWILLALVPLLFMQIFGSGSGAGVELTYTEFREQLASGNVREVTIVESRTVEGELVTPVSRDGENMSRFVSMLPGEITDGLIEELQARNVVIGARAARTPVIERVFAILPWILMAGIWIWFVRSLQSGGNRAFQFGRSKAKLISPDTPKVTFEDVAGADEAKEELEEVIEFLKDPQRFVRLGGRLPKGVLLVGPPGTGKTLLARAVAGEAARPFFQMSGSDFVEMFVGVGASRVRDLFEQGKSHAPCIIFVDEIDAVGRHRGAGLGGGHDEREQTLNALLVEMDGFESNDGVILLAATNRPDVLDPALLRPGRFDRQVVVDSPDIKGREGILRVHARKLPLAEDVDLSVIARGTPGLSGADLANVCNEAALVAARSGADRVAMSHFEMAKDKVMLGAERKSLVLTESERELTAYHEAGHAVVGLRIPGLDPVHKVTIVPRGRALGITASLPEEDRHSYTKEWLEGQLVMLFGGRVAEEMRFGQTKVTTGAGNDIERATTMARRMVTRFGMSDRVGLMAVGDSEQEIFLGRELVQRREVSEHTAQLVDSEVKRLLDDAHERARTLLEEQKDLLEIIAQALLDRETLGRREIELIERGEPLPPMSPEEPALAGEANGSEPPEAGEQPGAATRPSSEGGPDPLREPEEAVPVSSASVEEPAARTRGSPARDP